MYHIHLPLHDHRYGHICLTLVIFLFVFGTLKKTLSGGRAGFVTGITS